MKIINKAEKKINVVLEDGDVLEVSSLYGNKEHIFIECLDSKLHIEELSVSKIKEKSLEEKEIVKMSKYLDEESKSNKNS